MKGLTTFVMVLALFAVNATAKKAVTRNTYEHAALQSNMDDCRWMRRHVILMVHMDNMMAQIDNNKLTARERLFHSADYADSILNQYSQLPFSVEWRLRQIKHRATRYR